MGYNGVVVAPGQTITIDNPAQGTSLYDTYYLEAGEEWETTLGEKGKLKLEWSGEVEGEDQAIGYMSQTLTGKEDWESLGAPRFSLHASFDFLRK